VSKTRPMSKNILWIALVWILIAALMALQFWPNIRDGGTSVPESN